MAENEMRDVLARKFVAEALTYAAIAEAAARDIRAMGGDPKALDVLSVRYRKMAKDHLDERVQARSSAVNGDES